MARAVVVLDQKLDVSERYRVELKVYEVQNVVKYPEGVKVRFVLLDVLREKPVLLVDNHAPYGFHVHDGLPDTQNIRRPLGVRDYREALDVFRHLVKEILKNEN